MSQNKQNKVKITRDMNLADVLFRWPQTAQVFMDYGLHCVGCGAAGFDTIEMGAKIHQLSDEEVDEMVEDANNAAFKQE
jgi:hybrid cluster-associated redox disulfide protein